jgi:Calcineurin-like phosphoesterase
MPTPKTSDAVLQRSLDLVEHYGSGFLAVKAGVKEAGATAIERRAQRARLKGMRPTVRKDAPRVYQKERLGKMHIIIPDTQVKHGVPLDHFTWIGNYIAEKQPDEVIHIGDLNDFESLSQYDKGTIRGENKRLKRDIAAGTKANDLLWNAVAKRAPKYNPNKTLTKGNHEERLDRLENENPYLEEIVGPNLLRYEDWGWKTHPFLNVATIDGVDYSHYFASGEMLRPVSSARALMNRRKMRSAIMGHVQKTDVCFDPVTHQWFIFCGICYLHDEPYLRQQGNLHRRQILVLHEVEDGKFDPMFVSLRFLEKSYG